MLAATKGREKMEAEKTPGCVINKRTSVAILILWALFCALIPLALALEGPVPTPPGGVMITQSGACTDLGRDLGECMGRTGGTDFAFTNFDLSQSLDLYWGPVGASAVGLAFDCFIDEPGETMTLDLGQSDLASGIAIFTGTAEITIWDGNQWVTPTLNTRFTLTSSDSGGPLSLISGSSLGIAGTVVVTVTGSFTSNLLMEAEYGGVYAPALELFDALWTRPEHEYCAISTVDHGFFYTDDAITGLAATNDSPTTLGDTTTLTATIATGTNVTYTWALGDLATGSGAVVSHIYPAAGTYTAIVTASNSAGFITETTVVTVDESISGLAATNDSPTTLGDTTTLTATIATGTNVAYTWDLGDLATGSGPVVSHVYPAAGTYTAIVTASNSVGFITATTTITIVDESISGLAATNDSPTTLGDTTTLTATIATGTNVAYTWALGDLATGSGAVVSHIYPAAGTYTASRDQRQPYNAGRYDHTDGNHCHRHERNLYLGPGRRDIRQRRGGDPRLSRCRNIHCHSYCHELG
jgi:PKD repeat protein